MKKSLIALAALATVGVAQAQSSVTVSGRMDIGYSDKKLNPVGLTASSSTVTTAGDVKTSTIGANPFLTSFLAVSGSEDLGGGNRANFRVETGMDGSTATTLGNRGFWVELQGKNWGELRAGLQNTGARDVWISFIQTGAINIVGDLNSSTAEDAGGTAGHTAFNTGIKYSTPRVNGLQANAAIAKATTDTNGAKTGADAQSFGLSYLAGKFSAALSYSEGKAYTAAASAITGSKLGTDGTTVSAITTTAGNTMATGETLLRAYSAATTAYETKSETTAAAAAYDLGFARVSAIYMKNDTKRSNTATSGAIDRESTTLSASVPVGKTVLFGSVGKGTQTTAGNGFKGDLDAYQVGGRYFFSKRTYGYLATGKVEHELSATTKTNYRETAVGMLHLF